MKKLLILLFFCLANLIVNAQCPSQYIRLNNQQDVDNFSNNYPNCENLFGLSINGTGIIDLSPLSSIKSVINDFTISNTRLRTLSGLEGLNSIGRNLRISNNTVLENFNGLNNLTSIGGNMSVASNTVLKNFSGADNLTSIQKDLIVSSNNVLEGFEGMNLLSSIEGNISITYNTLLPNLSGLNNLNLIGGSINISYNNNLNSLSGIENIITVEDNLYISNNPVLSDISGLKNITEFKKSVTISSNLILANLNGLVNVISIRGSLIIHNNEALLEIDGLGKLESVNGDIEIEKNDLLNNLSGLNNLILVGGNMKITSNSALSNISEFNALNSVQGYLQVSENQSLTEISGINMLSSQIESITITDNASLLNITGLNSVPIISKDLTIQDNNLLNNISGFNTISLIDGSLIINNSNLISISGFTSLYSIESLLLTNNKSLSNFDGLEGLTTITGNLGLSGNDTLVNLNSLTSLMSVGEGFSINNNSSLVSLEGLENLRSIGTYCAINRNSSLINIDGLDFLETIGGDLTLGKSYTTPNIYPSEGNPQLKNISFNELRTIGGRLQINLNESLSSISGFNKLESVNEKVLISGNNALINITGFNTLTFVGMVDSFNNGISISNNDSLEIISGFNALLNIDNLLFISHDSLEKITGFTKLNTIRGDLRLLENIKLTDISGFSSLNLIKGDLNIDRNTSYNSLGNESLIGLNGFLSLSKVEGDFVIGNNTLLEDFSGLNNLIEVSGDFLLNNNPSLLNFKGLESLEIIGGHFDINFNSVLQDFTGLNSLSSIGSLINGGNFNILGNTSLINFNGLDSFTVADGVISIWQNENMKSLDGLNQLTDVGGFYLSNVPLLESISGLENLKRVNDGPNYSGPGQGSIGEFNIVSCNGLAVLDGLENLNTVSYLNIEGSQELIDISALSNIDHNTLSYLYIRNNRKLAVCNEVSICNYIDSVSFNGGIYGNAAGCSSKEEILELCNTGNNIISGTVLYDLNKDNLCDTNDIIVNNRAIVVSNDISEIKTFTNQDGAYKLFVGMGNYTTSLLLDDINYTALPLNPTSSFSTGGNTDTINFCVSAGSDIHDVSVTLLPITEARPGFDATYQIIYENKGTTLSSGEITFHFDNTLQSFVSSNESIETQTINTITFNYNNLLPFERRTIDLTLNTKQPPLVNGDDILTLSVDIRTDETDIIILDNNFELVQIVVNSFDPNDKQVVQGDKIAIEKIDEYLHYIIRFQNTGTASAINVRIRDILENKLNWDTFTPLSSSHSYRTQINEGNIVDFIFDNILLPAEQDNEPDSHGFIAFKVKPKNNVNIGDIITGKAGIYFDFNPPIITNTVSTEITNNSILNVNENKLENYFIIYPNPTSGTISLFTKAGIDIEKIKVYSTTGRLLIENNKVSEEINLNSFPQGIYLIKLVSNKGITTKKIVKN